MSFKRYIISFKRHKVCFYFHSTLIVLISFLRNIGKEMSPPGFRRFLITLFAVCEVFSYFSYLSAGI